MAKNLDVLNSDSNNIFQTLLIIFIVGGIAYLVYYLYNKANTQDVIKHTSSEEPTHINQHKNSNQNNESNYDASVHYKMNGKPNETDPIMNKTTYLPKGNLVGENNIEHFSQNPVYKEDRTQSSFPKEQLSAEELLPQDNSSLWAQVNPSGEGSLKDRNFLQSGYHIGINTVGQTLRNANLQLRSEPPCPQVRVSPWLQATIEPDLGRKPFEIGGCA